MGERTWNYRLVNTPSENDGEDWLCLKEVYYDDNGKPVSYSDICMGSETVDGVLWLIEEWEEAATMPVLHEDDFNKGNNTCYASQSN